MGDMSGYSIIWGGCLVFMNPKENVKTSNIYISRGEIQVHLFHVESLVLSNPKHFLLTASIIPIPISPSGTRCWVLRDGSVRSDSQWVDLVSG